ncbi:hypothetical protein [Roseovarius ramblicola]|uniref:Uncharacterized protein n=1 Tax=Roseovarius ramblicola TaxID=2022336 RepID=A0ABV5I4G2_9RHOB
MAVQSTDLIIVQRDATLYSATVGDLPSVSSAGTITSGALDLSTGNSFKYALTANATLTFSNIPAGFSMWHLTVTATGTNTMTLPTMIEMGGAAALDPPADGETRSYTFWSYDGGTTIYGGASA